MSGQQLPGSTVCHWCWACHCPALPGIPVGDLFVAMESWEEPSEVARAMGEHLQRMDMDA